MKYIRTKDGIYEVINNCVLGTRLVWWQLEYISKNKGNFYIDGKIVCERVADTIEELCDWKVYRLNGTIKWVAKELADLGQCFEITDFENWYGALDTDKGLIYVAKMNSKGELELL